jgi:hypothetical protein
MTDQSETLRFALLSSGEIVVQVGTRAEAATLSEFLALKPKASAIDLAKIINRLIHDRDFELIADPEAFKKAFNEKLASEDSSKPWAEGVIRLSDYGVPDFALLSAPAVEGGTLVYFATEATTGLPFRAEVNLAPGSAEPGYLPMTLTPVP